jgi:3-hydroxyisobutyrate dehydrogenase
MVKRVGFIGLGNIGMPMAKNLTGGAFDVVVYDVREEAAREVEALGATMAASAREVGERAEVIGICVRDDADTEAVVLGDDGILAARAGPGSTAGGGAQTVVAIHSTIRPHTVERLAAEAARHGVAVLDAPITGGQAGAMNRSLCYMVGGDAEVLERCRPVFETSAKSIVHAGPQGSGAKVKLCNNLMTYLGFLAAFEGSALAREAGLSYDVLEQVTRANGVMTDQMQLFLVLRNVADDKTDDAELQSYLRGFTTLAEKDLTLTLELAREVGLALPGTGLCQQLMGRVFGLADRKRR